MILLCSALEQHISGFLTAVEFNPKGLPSSVSTNRAPRHPVQKFIIHVTKCPPQISVALKIKQY